MQNDNSKVKNRCRSSGQFVSKERKAIFAFLFAILIFGF